jgi:hypothetical protein
MFSISEYVDTCDSYTNDRGTRGSKERERNCHVNDIRHKPLYHSLSGRTVEIGSQRVCQDGQHLFD